MLITDLKRKYIMAKGLRLTEKWMHRGLWLVAVVFACFLIGLGATVVGDLPQVERTLSVDDFMDPKAAGPLRSEIKLAERAERDSQTALEQARLQLTVAQANSTAARETFSNWLATRRATQLPEQDTELIARTKALDGLKDRERTAGAAVEAQQQAGLDAQQAATAAQDKLGDLQRDAQIKLDAENRRVELRVFLYRLALTLPLLLLAGWLFAKKRKTSNWPFVWGFIFFAAFVFFVELVPYLPSYGGYLYFMVGALATIIIGRRAIVALNRYLEKQKLAEQLPDAQRRDELSYDTALTRLSKGVCPGCERGVDLKNGEIDFCPHCGIGLFDRCVACQTRKSAFSKFCHACGTHADRRAPPPAMPASSANASAPTLLGEPLPA
jgi:predicted RNA-binding Zn-ribbon protein involved in translation (DUF1610 family)